MYFVHGGLDATRVDKQQAQLQQPHSYFIFFFFVLDSFCFTRFIRDSDLCTMDKLIVSFDIADCSLIFLFRRYYKSLLILFSILENWFLCLCIWPHLKLNLVLIIKRMPKLMGSPLGPVLANIFVDFFFMKIIYLKFAINRVCPYVIFFV